MSIEALHLDQIQSQLKQSIQKTGGDCEQLRDLGLSLQMQGDMPAAERCLRLALQRNPQHALSHYTLSRQLNYGEYPELLASLNNLQPNQCSNDEERILLCFAKGSVQARLGEHQQAARWFAEGNRLQRLKTPSDLDSLRSIIESRLHFPPDDPNAPSPPASTGAGVVFVVGLPRCGSTLLSSILNTNPEIADLGECQLLERCVSDHLNDPRQHPAAGIGGAYLQRIHRRSHKPLLVDKSLYNFANLGLIQRQLPGARVIHCRRDPLAQALSIHQTRFSEGSQYSTSVQDIAEMLVLERSTLARFQSSCPDQLYTLRYEQLCAAPEPSLRGLLQWLRLPWQPHYLQHHQTRHIVDTASLAQVRQPIHQGSMQRWRRYAALLKPMSGVLRQHLSAQELF